MKIFCRLLLLGFLITGLATNAQTMLDPAFVTPTAFAPAGVAQALQLADGSRVLLTYSSLKRINGQTADDISLCRFTAAGPPDAVFNARIASYNVRNFSPVRVGEYPGNKLLVALGQPFRIAGHTYNSLVLLNADGTVDASFAPTIPQFAPLVPRIYPYAVFADTKFVVQPDGKILVTNLDALPPSIPQRPLVRLLADGNLDTAFLTQFGNTLASTSAIHDFKLQPDGKILVAGEFSINGGVSLVRSGMFRLLPAGQLDGTFNLAATLLNARVAGIALQPDGKIIIGRESTLGQFFSSLLVRLLPGGAVDATFTNPPNLVGVGAMAVQPDGRILVAGAYAATHTIPGNNHFANHFLMRLLPTGAVDASFQAPDYGDYLAALTSLQLLANGQFLVAGSPKIYASASAVPTGVAVLSATGTYQNAFAPVLEQVGLVNSVAVQPDGKIVVGGNFIEINGVAVRNVARFSPSGTLDVAFSTACAATSGNETVAQVTVQPDGKVLLAGGFAAVGGQPRTGVARLLPSGQPDASFVPGLAANSVQNVTEITALAVQPDGQFLVSGHALYSPMGTGQPRLLMRLSTAGALDAGFQPPLISQGGLHTNIHPAVPLLMQPDGRILVADVDYQASATSTVNQPIIRLLANGTLDASFLPPAPTTTTAGSGVFGMERYADGRLLVYGDLYRFDGSTSFTNRPVVQLQPNGLLNPAFSAQLYTGICFAALIQPNQRVLAIGQLNRTSQSGPDWHPLRLLPMGALDTSFNSGQMLDYYVGSLALQTDGGILIGGAFVNPLTGNYTVLARLLDPNVLATAPNKAVARTAAYPVPAHDQLHLALDAASRPRQVQLFDAQGRAVLTQSVAQEEMTLNTAALSPGLYLLRVDYAQGGPVTRRVVLE